MGEAKVRKLSGDFPEKDGRTKAQREEDAAIQAMMDAERVPTMPSPFSWDCLRLRDQQSGERQIVLVMHSPFGPLHYFFAPEDFGKFRKFIDKIGDTISESDLTVVKSGIVVPGADQPV